METDVVCECVCGSVSVRVCVCEYVWSMAPANVRK